MRFTAFALGPTACALMLLLGPAGGMAPAAWRTAALGVWMAIWWLTEAVPIAATALLPLVMIPLLGIATMNAAAAPYANPVIFLFFGGFMLAAAFEKSGLHRRLALGMVSAVGTRPERIIAGFMLAAAFMSMWVSNTATVLMLLPLAHSMLRHEDAAGAATQFEKALLLGIAYAATIGGFGTLVGTPPNALLAGYLNQAHGIRVGFLDYMMIGVPIVVVSLPITWLLLTRVAFRVGEGDVAISVAHLERQRGALGPMSRAEKFVAGVAIATAGAWMTLPWIARAFPAVSEAGISVACAVVLLTVPLDGKWKRAIDWDDAERIPWGVLILFGGGLSLAGAIQEGGLATWIGDSVGALKGMHPLLILAVITMLLTALTEFTSNTATAAAFLPIASSLAVGAGMNPVLMAVAVGLAASNGFMLPVGTPPNAIVFGSGRLAIPEMARAGFLVDLLFVVLITIAAHLLVVPVLG